MKISRLIELGSTHTAGKARMLGTARQKVLGHGLVKSLVGALHFDRREGAAGYRTKCGCFRRGVHCEKCAWVLRCF